VGSFGLTMGFARVDRFVREFVMFHVRFEGIGVFEFWYVGSAKL